MGNVYMKKVYFLINNYLVILNIADAHPTISNVPPSGVIGISIVLIMCSGLKNTFVSAMIYNEPEKKIIPSVIR